tara:strand:+ start:2347 stop:3648 length:1302 start_codon:yes stop_codon:yes gene_type:complete
MVTFENIFLNKKILVYGLGKSGISTFKFLKNKSNVLLYDDFFLNIKNSQILKKLVSFKNILNSKFDAIILSPGIDIDNCKLSKYLKKNKKKIYTDLDIFYSFYKNECITITGTNGKSTTCHLLYKVLSDQNIDVRLVGNIGSPILSENKIKRKTIFVIEASSYQLDYSKIFKSKYGVILNLSLDHIERHKTLNKYVKAKFKLLKNQSKKDVSFVKNNDLLINKELKSNQFKSKIIKINTIKKDFFLKNIENDFFLTETNKENLIFVLAISKKLNLNIKKIKKTINKYRGLRYRQQTIIKKKNLIIINDSKSTSFSSSKSILQSDFNILWLVGGIPKKGDKFILPKKYFKNIKAFIYGKNKNFFIKNLKSKIKYENFDNLRNALDKVIRTIKKRKIKNQMILFSPCAASFDSFKNFEDRGLYFNKLIKRHLHEI